ncbi:alpha/beta fold hydrolase [Roseateles koreensis]|uniref:Alpha/beta hydrolase n=1 Tax=Roseateles koreensis TaxID=2987526 RepID=A0ABT5KW54_9BURK|nr:alpha/beta hydrolase [Roseateles koreensis]MDC8787170.1 alpha/beta hydrolase [Roseateles koreensis]
MPTERGRGHPPPLDDNPREGWVWRMLGLLLIVAALGFAASKAPDRPLETLVQRWAPPPSEFIDLQGQLVHLRDVGPRGDPAPLLLLHGTSASLHTWQGWVDGLQKQAPAHRVISVDLPGFGLTGPNAQDDYRTAAYVDFLQRLLSHLAVRQVVIAGNSLGGELAWEYAAAHPAQVKGLILVDAAGYAMAPDAIPLGFRLARIPVLGALGDYVLPRSVIERSVRAVYGDPTRIGPEVMERYFELSLRAGNRQALRHRLTQMQPGAHSEAIKSLHVPTLILWGDQDRLIPPSVAQSFAHDIAGSRLHMLPGLGHVPQEEDAQASLAPVLAFLPTLFP